MRTVIVALTGTVGGRRSAPARRGGSRSPTASRRVRARNTQDWSRVCSRGAWRAALDAAALDVSVEHAVEYWAIGVVVAAILGAALGGGPAAVAGAVVAGAGAPMGLAAARGRRARLIAASVPITIDGIASELRAGGTIATAVQRDRPR